MRLSIKQVVETLVEAVVLVFLVMFLFLQNCRATLIPTIAVPVVLLGTFAVLAIAGYSINTLTLFGMVLAIGLLVDDAIVVVENVERLIQTEELSAQGSRAQVDGRDHRRAGRHRAGAVGGVPADGVLRRIDRRHLSPVLDHDRVGDGAVGAGRADPDAGAVRDDPEAARSRARRRATGLLARFFRWFNDKFDRGQRPVRARRARAPPRSWKRSLLVYALIVVGMALLFVRLPTGFLPDEDQGIMIALVQGPSGATTRAHRRRGWTLVRDHFLKTRRRQRPGRVHRSTASASPGTGQNSGIAFIPLKDWEDRSGAENKAQAIAGRAMGAFCAVQGRR